MTTFKSDGTLPTGSVDITILESSEIYTANNFTWTQDTTSDVQRNHADGLPKGFEVKPGFTNGTLDLQLADSEQALPEINNTFSIGSLGYALTSRGLAKEQNGEWKLSAGLRLLSNPLITEPIAAVALTQNSAMTSINSAAVGPESGLTYTWSASSLPSGTSIDSSTGVISGTPDTVETTTAKIFASSTNSDGNTIKGVRYIPFTVTV